MWTCWGDAVADEEDAESIAAHLHIAEAKVTSAKARRQRFTAKYEAATNAVDRGAAKLQMERASEATVKAEREVRRLQKRLAEFQNREDEMRNDENIPLSMTPPHAGWTLRTKRTLNLNGRVLGPNTEISPADLAKMMNSEALLRGAHIAWTPPQAARPQRPAPAPAPVSSAPYVPVDHIRVLYDAMVALAARRNVPVHDCEDIVDRTLWDRAVKQFIDEPQMVMSQAWGGNNRLTQSGNGTARRIFDIEAFRKRLYSYGNKVEVAA
jgi:hypothetical protein